jgi:hypothetical protein
MKYIITENKLEQVVFKYLNRFYGNLEEYTKDEHPDRVFYIKDDKVYMEREKNVLWVDYFTIWKNLENIFSLKDSEIQHIITKWVKETYKLRGIRPHPIRVDEDWWWNKLIN